MDERDFDALIQARPFGTEGAKRADLQYRRSLSLAGTLWVQTAEDLRSQLLAPTPDVPPGFELADFRELLRITEKLSDAMGKSGLESKTIVIGTLRYTEWEARCEIIRRAINYLGNR
jgi:hypothetical protein